MLQQSYKKWDYRNRYIKDTIINPKYVVGLDFFWDADKTIGNDGDSISPFIDTGFKGKNATQATTANKPLLRKNQLNGANGLEFDGADDSMTFTAFNYSEITAFVVGKSIRSGSGASTWLGYSSSVYSYFLTNYDGVIHGGVTDTNVATINGTNNVFHLVEFHGSGSQIRPTYNGTQGTFVNTTTDVIFDTIGYPGSPSSHNVKGIYNVCIAFSRYLSVAEIFNIRKYCRWRFNLAISL